jgi:hypothetical protein
VRKFILNNCACSSPDFRAIFENQAACHCEEGILPDEAISAQAESLFEKIFPIF